MYKESIEGKFDYTLKDLSLIHIALIPEIQRPFFLAGGIGASNLGQAIREIHPYAVDLSSSVETEKWKDPMKIRQVVDIVREIKIIN